VAALSAALLGVAACGGADEPPAGRQSAATAAPEGGAGSPLREALNSGECPTDAAEVSRLVGRELASGGETKPGGCTFNSPGAFEGEGPTVSVSIFYDAGDVLDTARPQSEAIAESYGCEIADDPQIGDGAYTMLCDTPERLLAEIHFRAGGNTWVAYALVANDDSEDRPTAAELEKALRAVITD
jgi:hypothetical protein